MELLEQIREAGIVGCGGAGFPTHIKLGCQVEYLILNGAECEPLLRTDRWLMRHRAREIVAAANLVAQMVGASKRMIALKESYLAEIESLNAAIREVGGDFQLFRMKNFYPAGDEQILVCDVTGRTVPPAGIPLDVGAVVSNVATMFAIYEAYQGKPFTHKYLTVTGAVKHPTILYAPLGASFSECIEAAGGALEEECHVLCGGPMMGKLYSSEEAQKQVVTKTTSGIILVPKTAQLVRQRETPLSSILRRAQTCCIQCSYCTQLCPRYLTGHPLEPHRIMRKLAYAEDFGKLLEDEDIRQAQICSECGICETAACPMGLHPRQVNIFIKQELAKAGLRYEKKAGTFSPRMQREWRRIPARRLAARLELSQYYDLDIDELCTLQTSRVEIPLKQHIGSPSTPEVSVGDTVAPGQLIGAGPQKGLGSNIHASIAGVVTAVGERIVIEGR